MSDLEASRAAKVEERNSAAQRRAPYAELLELGVTIDVGAPLPHVIAKGGKTSLLFHRGLDDPSWDGTYTTVIDPRDEGTRRLALITFEGVVATLLGPPNDEALEGHPLAKAGLEPYRAHIVRNSAWISEHERRNRVHPHHSAERWFELTHYLVTFHDETFECVARSHRVAALDSSFPAAISSMIDFATSG